MLGARLETLAAHFFFWRRMLSGLSLVQNKESRCNGRLMKDVVDEVDWLVCFLCVA